MTALVTIGALLTLLSIGMPMIFALMATVMISLYLLGAWQMTIPQVVISQMGSFMLASFPLFILAGGLMNAGGVSGRLFAFAGSLVGFLRGGMAQIDVMLSIVFGGMVGSSMADLAATGPLTIPAMKKHGYPASDAAAITAASSGIGPLIPPSSPMILYSALTGTSLGALFLAGIIPGLILGCMMMLTVFVIAKLKKWPTHGTFEFGNVWRTGKESILAFGMPALIIGGLTFGIFTPTEAGAFGAAYSAMLSYCIYRTVTLKGLYRTVVNAVVLTGELTVILGLSAVLAWCAANANIPQMLASVIDAMVVVDSNILRLLVITVVAVVLGMFIDPLSPLLVPIVLPLLLAYNIDLVHFGVLMVMFGVIGQLTPPLGIALIFSGRIAGVTQMQVFWAGVPLLALILVFTVILIVFPSLSTWLPSTRF